MDTSRELKKESTFDNTTLRFSPSNLSDLAAELLRDESFTEKLRVSLRSLRLLFTESRFDPRSDGDRQVWNQLGKLLCEVVEESRNSARIAGDKSLRSRPETITFGEQLNLIDILREHLSALKSCCTPLQVASMKRTPLPNAADGKSESVPSADSISRDQLQSSSTFKAINMAAPIISNEPAELPHSIHSSLGNADHASNVPRELMTTIDFSIARTKSPPRRRGGPLSQVDKDRVALVRKLGACESCRKRKVQCQPGHLEDKANKMGINLASLDAASRKRRHTSTADTRPRRSIVRAKVGGETDSPEIDSTPTMEEKPRLPSFEQRVRSVLEDRTKACKYGRVYNSVSVLVLCWPGESLEKEAMCEVTDIMSSTFGYKTEVWEIPEEEFLTRRVCNKVSSFVKNDSRPDLKIVLYIGSSLIKPSVGRAMFLASSPDADIRSPKVDWSQVQRILIESRSDVLILLDCPCIAFTAEVGSGLTDLIAGSGPLVEHDQYRKASTFFLTALRNILLSSYSSIDMTVADLYNRILVEVQRTATERDLTVQPFRTTLTSSFESGLQEIRLPLHAEDHCWLNAAPEPDSQCPNLHFEFKFSSHTAAEGLSELSRIINPIPPNITVNLINSQENTPEAIHTDQTTSNGMRPTYNTTTSSSHQVDFHNTTPTSTALTDHLRQLQQHIHTLEGQTLNQSTTIMRQNNHIQELQGHNSRLLEDNIHYSKSNLEFREKMARMAEENPRPVVDGETGDVEVGAGRRSSIL